MQIDPLFPVLIYSSRVNDLENIQNECLDKIEKIGGNFFSKSPVADPNSHSLTDPTFSSNLIDDLQLGYLKDEIHKQVTVFMNNVGVHRVPKFRIFASWMTNTAPNEYTPTHDHALADLSGVYYIKTNGHDGNIFFNDPNPAMAHSLCFLALPKKRFYEPEVGKMIIFPGWLQHGVETNRTNDVRISISFNIYFDR